MLLGGARDTTLVVTQYMALFNNIIHRLRFPKFMTIASKKNDKEVSDFLLYVPPTTFLLCFIGLISCINQFLQGLDIFEGLLQHGRLTLTQILDRALSSSSEGKFYI